MSYVTREYRLNSAPGSQCHIAITNDRFRNDILIELISYSTSVCKIRLSRYDGNKLAELYASGTYSVTTARHINRFTTEFCGANLYYEVKLTCGGYCEYKKVGDIDFDRAFKQAEHYMDDCRVNYHGGC